MIYHQRYWKTPIKSMAWMEAAGILWSGKIDVKKADCEE
jgi:hypothetical protein